jgi:hypothetical protein
LVTKALREGRLARGCAAGASGKQERREIDLAPFLEGAAPGIMTTRRRGETCCARQGAALALLQDTSGLVWP